MTTSTERFYCACSANGDDRGLAIFQVESGSGRLQLLGDVSQGLTCPLYVTAHPRLDRLYLADFVKECDGEPGGAVVALELDRAAGQATILNRRPVKGTVPCYVTITRDGQFALVANYGDGSVSVLPILPDGTLGAVVCRHQHQPSDVGEEKSGRNAHSVILSPDERFAFAADLGLDAIFVYRFDTGTGQLAAHSPSHLRTARKAGPRHLLFGPGARFLYCATEYDNTLIVMSYDAAAGKLAIEQTLPMLPAGHSDKSYGSDLAIHPSGRFLYATNRGHDSIVCYQLDSDSGRLTLAGHTPSGGSFPRSILFNRGGDVLVCANEKAGAIVTFRVDAGSGALSPTGQSLATTRPASLWRA
jgi:6-phosphogluconolactonase